MPNPKQRGCVASFKVYPGRHIPYKGFEKYYWEVFFFKNKFWMRKAFQRFSKLRGDKDSDDRFGAIVMPMQRQYRVKGERRWKYDGCIGVVLFSVTQSGSETLSHECVHMATNFWLRAKPKYLALLSRFGEKEDDEPLAYVTGQCMRQLVNALYRFKLIK